MGAKIDPSYDMPDGKHFENVRQFQDLVCRTPERLAANVAEKVLVYGTGAEISFADRETIEQVVQRSATDNYGFRSIILAAINSRIFLNK